MRPFSLHRRQAPDPAVAGLTPRSARLAGLLSLLLAFACADVGTQAVLRLSARPLGVPVHALTQAADGVEALAEQAPRLYGATPERAPAPRRFRLFGVIGGGADAGAALIGVDGGPAAVFPVGAELAPGVLLVSTHFGRVEIERQGRRSLLETEPARAEAPGPAAAGLGVPDGPGAVMAPGMPAHPLPAPPALEPGAAQPRP